LYRPPLANCIVAVSKPVTILCRTGDLELVHRKVSAVLGVGLVNVEDEFAISHPADHHDRDVTELDRMVPVVAGGFLRIQLFDAVRVVPLLGRYALDPDERIDISVPIGCCCVV
jgi:hypothetical protein